MIPNMSAYGIDDYHFAVTQLAQTSLRSAIGKISLDNTFEACETLNGQVVMALDEATTNSEFGKLAKVNNTMIVPGNLTDMNSMVASAMATFQHVQKGKGTTGDEPEAVLRRN
jgi:regulator of protease activity HflC (stomatin/prohibitin superfamily)